MDTDHLPFPTADLHRWYEREKRDLPWRGSTDPYAIWISEVILQQTRVDQGMPYYQRFLGAFPTVTHLAEATEDEVMKLWEGLGYYSRARNLHVAAKRVAFELGGEFPMTYDGLRGLKGVGPYTAAAIGSIAFGLPVACVDGNVTRVLARFHGISEPVDSTPVIRAIDRWAQEALDRSDPGAHNQAMMELGATVCLPKNVKCGECPVRSGCAALRMGTVDAIPFKAKRTKVRERHFHYLVLTDGECTVIERRPAGDIWQGLYQFPMLEGMAPAEVDEIVRAFPETAGGVYMGTQGPFRHILTHQRILAKFSVFRMDGLPDSLGQRRRWADMDGVAFPRLIHHYLDKKLFAHIEKV